MPDHHALFVDESGEFTPGDCSLVVGLHFRVAPSLLQSESLRRALGDIWGPGPYPPHAALVRQPASHVIYSAYPDERADWMPMGRLARETRQSVRLLWDRLRASRLADRLIAIEEGAFPTDEDVKQATLILRGRSELAPVQALRDRQIQEMNHLVKRVFESPGVGPVTIFAALADAGPPGDEPLHLQVQHDAYTRALGVVHERLSRTLGPEVVETRILSRHVTVGGLGAHVNLQSTLLTQIQAEALTNTQGECLFENAQGTVIYKHVPEQGRPFHPMLALADWIANGVRHVVRFHTGTYGELEKALVSAGVVPSRDHLRCRPVRGGRVLPTLAAAGDPEEGIRRVNRGERHLPAISSYPAWAWEQARMWEAGARP